MKAESMSVRISASMYIVIFSGVSSTGFVDSTNNTANCTALGYSVCFNNADNMTSVYPGTTCGYEKH